MEVDTQYVDLHDIADLDDLGGVADVAVAELGDVDEAVLVDADGRRRRQVDDVRTVPVSSMPGFRSFKSMMSVRSIGGGSFVADVAAGLF